MSRGSSSSRPIARFTEPKLPLPITSPLIHFFMAFDSALVWFLFFFLSFSSTHTQQAESQAAFAAVAGFIKNEIKHVAGRRVFWGLSSPCKFLFPDFVEIFGKWGFLNSAELSGRSLGLGTRDSEGGCPCGAHGLCGNCTVPMPD